MRHNNSDDVIRIINEDCTGRKLLRINVQASDEKDLARAFRLIITKYGLHIKIIDEKPDTLAWLKQDEEFKF